MHSFDIHCSMSPQTKYPKQPLTLLLLLYMNGGGGGYGSENPD